MEKKTYAILVDAPKEKVWEILWSEKTYRQWTAAFSEDSNARSDWNEGSKVYFLAGNSSGMISIIEKKIPNEFMSFQFIGEMNNGVEDYDSEKVKKYAGTHENYTLSDENGKTKVTVEMDLEEEYFDFMDKAWSKAFEKLKQLAEV